MLSIVPNSRQVVEVHSLIVHSHHLISSNSATPLVSLCTECRRERLENQLPLVLIRTLQTSDDPATSEFFEVEGFAGFNHT